MGSTIFGSVIFDLATHEGNVLMGVLVWLQHSAYEIYQRGMNWVASSWVCIDRDFKHALLRMVPVITSKIQRTGHPLLASFTNFC